MFFVMCIFVFVFILNHIELTLDLINNKHGRKGHAQRSGRAVRHDNGQELQHTPQLRIVVGVGSCEVHF